MKYVRRTVLFASAVRLVVTADSGFLSLMPEYQCRPQWSLAPRSLWSPQIWWPVTFSANMHSCTGKNAYIILNHNDILVSLKILEDNFQVEIRKYTVIHSTRGKLPFEGLERIKRVRERNPRWELLLFQNSLTSFLHKTSQDVIALDFISPFSITLVTSGSLVRYDIQLLQGPP